MNPEAAVYIRKIAEEWNNIKFITPKTFKNTKVINIKQEWGGNFWVKNVYTTQRSTLVSGHRITQIIQEHRQSKGAMLSTKKHKNPGVKRTKQYQTL